MKKENFNGWDVLYISFFIIVFGFAIGCFFRDMQIEKDFDKGYKQGQIDALNGIQNYDKIIKQDTIYIKIR